MIDTEIQHWLLVKKTTPSADPFNFHDKATLLKSNLSARPARILHIDAWRFIAVALVIISHVLKFSNPWYRENLPWIIMARAQNLGHFGVEVFFCISGFVICRGMLAEKMSTGAISMQAFYVRRFLRILPPLLLYMLALAALNLADVIEVKAGQFIHAGLFLCNFDLGKCGWLLAHTWSLAYEEQFYLFFPVVFVLASLFGGRRTVLGITISMVCAALVAAYINQDGIAVAIGTFTCMLTGCVAAMYWEDIAPVLERMSTRSWLILAAISFMIGSIVIWPKSIELFLHISLVPLLICAMVLSTPTKSPRIAGFFLNPKVTYLGTISFTIYLWQQLATSADLIKSPWINFCALAGTIVVGVLSYRYLERPLMGVGAAFSKRVIAAKAARASATAYSRD